MDSKHIYEINFVWIGLQDTQQERIACACSEKFCKHLEYDVSLCLGIFNPFSSSFPSPFFTHSSGATFVTNFTLQYTLSSFTFHQQFQFSTLQFFSLFYCRKHFFLLQTPPTLLASRVQLGTAVMLLWMWNYFGLWQVTNWGMTSKINGFRETLSKIYREALKIEAVCSFETLVTTYKFKWCYNAGQHWRLLGSENIWRLSIVQCLLENLVVV
jgi:hypothetical protein